MGELQEDRVVLRNALDDELTSSDKLHHERKNQKAIIISFSLF
jgi:hypothetical protein